MKNGEVATRYLCATDEEIGDLKGRFRNGGGGDWKYGFSFNCNPSTRVCTGDVIPTYSVIFDSNGGSLVSFQNISEGSGIVKPLDPAKLGYSFSGRYTDNNTFLREWNFTSDVVTGDMILYAKWIPDLTQINELSYTVEYYTNTGKIATDTFTGAVWVTDPQELNVGIVNTG
ncbi:MAG: InlB B-repeat-containing protein, partial [Candidatus Peribacteria bacterium]|nr:InlB B-repeat-containing protein [Candidatus Peribacteria bacterium]